MDRFFIFTGNNAEDVEITGITIKEIPQKPLPAYGLLKKNYICGTNLFLDKQKKNKIFYKQIVDGVTEVFKEKTVPILRGKHF